LSITSVTLTDGGRSPDQGTFNSTTIGHVEGICKIKGYYQN